MATANLPALFNAQFIDDTGVPLSGGKLYTYISGTTTNQITYQDQGQVATNANPITLDAAGRCNLWLAPTLNYTLKLTRSDLTVIKTWDNVAGAALATSVVTSVNSLTGAVSLTAPLIPFTTGTSTTWFVGTDTAAALDSIITHVDSGLPAQSVTVADAGAYYTAPKNVENILQQLGARSSHGALIRVTPFTGSGTWTKGADVSFVVVEGVGGGGGSSTNVAGGGGGGAGGYFKRIVASPGSSETVTIGAGGAAGAVGGATSFGTWATGNGGGAATGTTAGGTGGTATGGTLNLQGNSGGSGGNTSANAIFGHGGGSFFGGGAPGQWNGGTATAGATNTGGGGSGSTSGGGAGGSGLVVVYEYS